jgi:hypothetical protein
MIHWVHNLLNPSASRYGSAIRQPIGLESSI